jgi:hypothetical protein
MSETSAAEKAARKKPTRKPMWVIAPHAPVAGARGEPNEFDARIVRCTTKKEVRSVLAKLHVDATNAQDIGVFVLRSDQIPPKLTTQVIIKF